MYDQAKLCSEIQAVRDVAKVVVVTFSSLHFHLLSSSLRTVEKGTFSTHSLNSSSKIQNDDFIQSK
jgi:hypothetical protein